MRTWFGYDQTGLLRSVEAFAGGWPTTVDLSLGGTKHLDEIRADRAALGITAFIAFDCPCPPELKTCGCHNTQMRDYYVVNGVFVRKTIAPLVLGAQRIVGRQMINAALPVSIFMEGAVVDGELVAGRMDAAAGARDFTLTFSGGRTDAFVLPDSPRPVRVALAGRAVVQVVVSIL